MKLLTIFTFTMLLTSCQTGIIIDNYALDFDPNEEINLVVPCHGYQCIKIPGHILFYGHNNDFLIANQKLTGSIRDKYLNLPFPQMQQQIFQTNLNKFWIVKLATDSLYGPLSLEEYLILRQILDVPKNLKLNNSTLSLYTQGQRKDVEYDNPDTTVVDIKDLSGE